MSEVVFIPKLGYRLIAVPRYDYAGNATRCPVCGGLGMPWGGWFSCEDCGAVGLVEAHGDWPAGQMFVAAPGSTQEEAKP